MRYYQPPQQQLVRIGNTADKELQFTTGMMERMYQNMMQSEQMKGQALKDAYGIQYLDSNAWDEVMVPGIKEFEQSISKGNPLQTMRAVQKLQATAIPFQKTSEAQIKAKSAYDQVRLSLGADAIFGNDPAQMSIRKEDGSFRNPQEFDITYYRPSAIAKEIEEINKDRFKSSFETELLKSNPLFTVRRKHHGVSDDEIEALYGVDSAEAERFVMDKFATSDSFKATYMQQAGGNEDRAIQLALQDVNKIAKNTLGMKYSEDLIQTPRVKSSNPKYNPNNRLPGQGMGKTTTQTDPNSLISQVRASTSEISDKDFDANGNISSNFVPERDASLTNSNLKRVQENISKISTELEELNSKLQDPAFGLTEEDFTIIKDGPIAAITGETRPMNQKEVEYKLKKQQERLKEKIQDLNKNLNKHKANEKDISTRLSEYSNKYGETDKQKNIRTSFETFRTNYGLPTELPHSAIDAIITDNFIENPNLVKTIDFESARGFEPEMIYNQYVLANGRPQIEKQQKDFYIISGRESVKVEGGQKDSDYMSKLYKAFGATNREDLVKALKTAPYEFVMIGGTSPGAIRYTVGNTTIELPSNADISIMAEPGWAMNKAYMEGNFNEQNFEQTAGIKVGGELVPIIGFKQNAPGKTATGINSTDKAGKPYNKIQFEPSFTLIGANGQQYSLDSKAYNALLNQIEYNIYMHTIKKVPKSQDTEEQDYDENQ